jgi:hypothetical protein
LCGLRQSRRGNNLAGKLVDRTDIHQLASPPLLKDGKYIFFVGANGFIRLLSAVGQTSDPGKISGQRPVFRDPLLAAPIDETGVPVSVVLELSKCISSEPVVVVSVKQHGGVIENSGLPQ